MESKEVAALQAEIQHWKQIAAGYQSYQDRLLREIELFTAHVGTKLATEVMMAALGDATEDRSNEY
jgi:hypothetical protein